MDKNFRVRVIVGFSLFFLALIAMYTFEAIPFKIIYGLFAILAIIELISFFWRKHNTFSVILALFQIVFLVCSVIFIAMSGPEQYWYIILGVCGYDIFAYLFGKAFRGRVFGESRPFPKISKNKTWEGTILGLIMSICMCVVLMSVRGNFTSDWMFLLCGPLALIGDLYESYLKRKFNVKDSNEIVMKNKFFKKLEIIVGGSDGHGGFLDRFDSLSFAGTILLVISLIRICL